ncbi:MAG TPA: hypothetical protein VIM75_12735 [Ohtaekwangia sp.]|uniref:hypothetical protein n=1 Tax=Ohtaekwangia sp. TaxID=2066019 RepID=UPI002F92CD77
MPENLSTEKSLPPKVEDAIKNFLDRTPPNRLSRTVLLLLMEYLIHQHDFLPLDFHVSLGDLSNLFKLFDQLDAATKGWYDEMEGVTE